MATPPSASPYVDSATGKMIEPELTQFNRNVQYISTAQCAKDLASLLPDFSPQVIAGPPDDTWNNFVFAHGTETPAIAPWIKVSANGQTTQVNAGTMASLFRGQVGTYDVANPSRGFPGAVTALGRVKEQIQDMLAGLPNF